MQRSQHRISFIMILSVSGAFGANEDSFDDNENPLGAPLTSTHFAPNSRKSRRGA
jgi:hypothetical protein